MQSSVRYFCFYIVSLIRLMITKEQVKKEVDRIPENLLGEAYTILKRLNERSRSMNWLDWQKSLDKFSPDFMTNRIQPSQQNRDSF